MLTFVLKCLLICTCICNFYIHIWYYYVNNCTCITISETIELSPMLILIKKWYGSLGVVHVWARWHCFSHFNIWLVDGCLGYSIEYLLFSSLLSMDWWFRLLRVIQTILYPEFPIFYISHNFENNPELCVLVVFTSVYLVAYNQILQMGSYKSYYLVCNSIAI